MSNIKNPENYSLGKDQAKWLRGLADDIEKNYGKTMVNIHLQMWFAAPNDVERAIKRKKDEAKLLEVARKNVLTPKQVKALQKAIRKGQELTAALDEIRKIDPDAINRPFTI